MARFSYTVIIESKMNSKHPMLDGSRHPFMEVDFAM